MNLQKKKLRGVKSGGRRDTFLAVVEKAALRHVPVGRVFQSDGAPPHFFHRVCAFLDRNFPDRWIGTGEPIPWPPHSQDLTPLDFPPEGL